MANMPTGAGRAVQGQSAVTMNQGQKTDIALTRDLIIEIAGEVREAEQVIGAVFNDDALIKRDVQDLLDETLKVVALNADSFDGATCLDALKFAAFVICSFNIGISAPINFVCKASTLILTPENLGPIVEEVGEAFGEALPENELEPLGDLFVEIINDASYREMTEEEFYRRYTLGALTVADQENFNCFDNQKRVTKLESMKLVKPWPLVAKNCTAVCLTCKDEWIKFKLFFRVHWISEMFHLTKTPLVWNHHEII